MARLPLAANETTARVLALLSSMPGQELHTNEIVRRTGSLPNAVQRALTRSEAGGLIQSRRVGNLRLWRMDQKNPLYGPIRQMFARTRGIPARLAALLRSDRNIRLAFLFGSYVTAQDDPTSDIDLFVVGSPDWVALGQAVSASGRQVGREINPVVWTEEDLRRPAPTQRSFLDSVLAAPILWLIGDRTELDRLRVGTEVAGHRRRRSGVAPKRPGAGPKSEGSRLGRQSPARARKPRQRA